MNSDSIKVLLLESNPEGARMFQEILTASSFLSELVYVQCLEDALEHLVEDHFNVFLFSMSNSQELDKLRRIYEHSPNVPIVILSDVDDRAVAVAAVKEGAQDYLVKSQLGSYLLGHSILYAIERHRLREELRTVSLKDELTGLYNRRGFMLLAKQNLKLAYRTKRCLSLVFADLDGLKRINDTFGHPEGDAALRHVSEILTHTFRNSDLIARIGGDEFAVLAFETANVTVEMLTVRLQRRLEAGNRRQNSRYDLSLSLGCVRCNPAYPRSIYELLKKADELMYNDKRKKRAL